MFLELEVKREVTDYIYICIYLTEQRGIVTN